MGDSHARAAQRVQLMRMAQGSLQPSPRCLDHPPPGMMQLCHRESVVQFINEVRPRLCSRPRPAHASRPIASADRAPIFSLCATCTPLISPLGTSLSRAV